MTVKEYNNTSQYNKVDKNITLITTHDCTLYNSVSILNPVLKFKNVPTGNYIYIPYYGRYYYITDVVTSNQCCYVYCKVDVLMTYKENIYGTVQMVSRCESLHDPMLVDTAINMGTDNAIYTRAFGNEIITNHFTYILGVI